VDRDDLAWNILKKSISEMEISMRRTSLTPTDRGWPVERTYSLKWTSNGIGPVICYSHKKFHYCQR
jgi:hypothetical protein